MAAAAASSEERELPPAFVSMRVRAALSPEGDRSRPGPAPRGAAPMTQHVRSLTGLLLVLTALACQRSSVSAATALTTVRVASGLSRPLYITAPPGDTTRLFIVEQYTGRIRILMNGSLLSTPFLTQTGVATGGNEQGLLGLAFHPHFSTNHFFY